MQRGKENHLVTIGIPTYNRPEGLYRLLNNVTEQTFKNLEIIVSDNCSPGTQTEKVVREFIKNDSRIQYFRQSKNIGPTKNLNYLLKISKGKYFMWLADDDEVKNTYVEKLLDGLRQNSKAVLAYSLVDLYSADGKKVISPRHIDDIDTRGYSVIKRLYKVIVNLDRNSSFYGLYKKSSLKGLEVRNIYTGDISFIVDLASRGEFILIPELLFLKKTGGVSRFRAQLGKMFSNRPFIQDFIYYFPMTVFMLSHIKYLTLYSVMSFYLRILSILIVIRKFLGWRHLKLILAEYRLYIHIRLNRMGLASAPKK